MVRLPPTIADIESVMLLKPISFTEFEKLIVDMEHEASIVPPTLPAESEPTSTAPASRSSRPRSARSTRSAELTPSGSKFNDRGRCMSRAIHDLGIDAPDDNIIDHADELYNDAEMNGGERDSDRDTSWKAILKHDRSTWKDASASGGHSGIGKDGEPMFGDEDKRRIHELLLSRISNAMLDAAAESCRKHRDSPITREHLTYAALTVGKNMSFGRQNCPLAAVIGMWHFFNLPGGFNAASIAVSLLRKAGFFTSNLKCAEGWGRQYQLSDLMLSLPYLVDFKPDKQRYIIPVRYSNVDLNRSCKVAKVVAGVDDLAPLFLYESGIDSVVDQTPSDIEGFEVAECEIPDWDCTTTDTEQEFQQVERF